MSDDELVCLAREGGEDAFRELLRRYRTYIYRVVLPVVGDPKLAEDAAQEALVKIYFALPQYRSPGLKTWMARIAVHQAIDVRRKRERLREDLLDVDGMRGSGVNEPALDDRRVLSGHADEGMLYSQRSSEERPVEQAVLERWHRERLHSRLDELPETYRSVVYAYYIREESYQQIAESQRIAVKTVESQLYRARHWMRKHWKEEEFR